MARNDLATKVMKAGSAGLAALSTYLLVIRPWYLTWGATEAEFDETLPGDEIVPSPKHKDTPAITIHAPIADVWPWLVQVGQHRGGFYSYEWLENLIGCDIHNADQLVPEWQSLRSGDKVWLHPKASPLPVLIIEPYRAIVLGSNTNDPATWGFFLKELNAYTTRLLIRSRWQWRPGLLYWLGCRGLLEPIHCMMERKMLLGIKQRAEVAARQRLSAASEQ